MKNTPFLLIILDGWGIAPAGRSNAISQAKKPVYDQLLKNYWVQVLQAGGDAVGLPWGEMGNSEVGHLGIGAGKIVYQNLPRITKAIADRSFFNNPQLASAMKQAVDARSTLHLIGLLSDGGVHSHIEHLYALLEMAASAKVPRIAVHAILDGRDVSYNSAPGYLEDLAARLAKLEVPATIATISGRYFTMDRDNRWDRVQSAYQTIVFARSTKNFDDPQQALKFYYDQKIYDEQLPPTVIGAGAPISSNDSVIFFNFRSDRMRQLVNSFTLPDFNKFERGVYLKNLKAVTMVEYDKALPVEIAFPPEMVTKPLAAVLAEAGVKQLHIAETEKYAHVTFFLNGGREEAFTGETRILVPSPQVSSYDEVPEMAAPEITARLVRELATGQYGFCVVNFANADMIAHTGNLKATIAAVETLDRCLKELVELVLSISGVVLITADHGNAEVLFDPQTGEINKEHSNYPVPCIIIGASYTDLKTDVPDLATYTPHGVLGDVAPTILRIMDIKIPVEMTGRALL